MAVTQEEREARLREEAGQGRRWAVALEVLEEFCNQRRREIVNLLETYGDSLPDETVKHRIADLYALRKFLDAACAYIDEGKIAERKLNDEQ